MGTLATVLTVLGTVILGAAGGTVIGWLWRDRSARAESDRRAGRLASEKRQIAEQALTEIDKLRTQLAEADTSRTQLTNQLAQVEQELVYARQGAENAIAAAGEYADKLHEEGWERTPDGWTRYNTVDLPDVELPDSFETNPAFLEATGVYRQVHEDVAGNTGSWMLPDWSTFATANGVQR